MKPRNRYERAVLAQSAKLPKITKSEMKWAFRECIDHYAYRLPKGRTTCMDCGHTWIMDKQRDLCLCPQCRTRLQVRETFERRIKQRRYFTTFTKCGEYQLLRMYLLVSEMEKGCTARYHIIEIGQYWWDAQGRMTVFAVQRTLGRYIDTFSFFSPMAIRNDNEAYQYIAQCPMYPKFKVLDILKRNGFVDNFHDINPRKLIPALLSDSRAETLMKLRRFEHLRYFLGNTSTFDRCWQSYKITLRNGYEIPDISIWCDYVDMLLRLNKDVRNPKHVCPPNLFMAHDSREEELRRQREKEEMERKRQKGIEDEERFRELKGMFFGISFTDGTIQVRVLESVREYMEEGLAMHHCVFTNEYYLKENSLILSATIEGRRIETIEVNLDTLRVEQSRGVCNQNTEYHDRIVSLVNKNKGLIRQRMRATA